MSITVLLNKSCHVIDTITLLFLGFSAMTQRFNLTKAGHICSDEGMKDLPYAAKCKYAAKIMQWGKFQEIKGPAPNQPTKCFKAPFVSTDKPQVFWNPNITGKRNKDVQAVCFGYW